MAASFVFYIYHILLCTSVHTPCGMRPDVHGFSHGLKKCSPDTFLPHLRWGRPFKSLLRLQKKEPHPDGWGSFFWRRRRDLNPRYPFGVYAISNRARSATTRLLHKICLRAQLAYNTTYAIFCQALFLLFLGLFEIVAKKYSPGKKIPGREILQQTDTGLFAGQNRFVIPDAGLNFTDMGAAHHQHGKS